VRQLFVPTGVALVIIFALSAAPAARVESQTPAGGVNPFQSPDPDFSKFPLPDPLPQAAGTVAVPKGGPWDAMNFPGDMICTGIVNLNLPLDPARDSGTIEIRNGGQTLFGDGLGSDTEDITMQSVPGIFGRYAGTVSGSPGGVPMSIDFYWQTLTDEWIIGYLTSHVDAQGLTCNMFRTYELRWRGEGGGEEPRTERVTICHHPPGNRENARTLTVGPAAVDAHLEHGDSRGPCKESELGEVD
jgi:hypothetical protein